MVYTWLYLYDIVGGLTWFRVPITPFNNVLAMANPERFTDMNGISVP